MLSPENRRLLMLLLGSAFVVILNETTMAVALPRIMEAFGVEATAGQWLTTAFMLTMAVVIPTTGWLLGRLGTRRAFVVAMSIFTLGTAVAAIAPFFGLLLGARVIQAIGTAIMMPLLMTTVMEMVPAHARGRIMGNVSLVIAAAPALGPSASGLILNHLSWRWIFIIMLPIAGVSLTAGLAWVRDFGVKTSTRLDVISLPLAAVGFGSLVWGLSSLSGGGHGADVEPGEVAAEGQGLSPWLMLAISAVTLVAFVWRQLNLARRNQAFLDVRVLAVRDFLVAVALMCMAMFAMFGVLILLPLYLQQSLGLEPLDAGLLTLPGALLMGLMGPVVGRWYDRIGARFLSPPGLLVAAIGFAVMAGGSDTVAIVLTGHVLMSLGVALVFTPMFTLGLGSLSGPQVPHGSATLGTLQQVAGAAGTAAFVSLATARQNASISAGASFAEALSDGVHLTLWISAAIMAGISLVAAGVLRKSHPVKRGAD